MSATLSSVEEFPTSRPIPVSMRVLLWLYLIIPLCLLLQALDTSWWQGYFKSHLPNNPNHFLLFQILFGTPHIIASAVVLVSNRDYWQCFQRKVLLMTLAVALVFGLGSLFIPYQVLYIVVAVWTVLHVLKQQLGIAQGVCRLPAWAYRWLLWLSVLAGVFLYLGIFMKNSLSPQQSEWLQHAAAALCVGLVASALLFHRQVQTPMGRWFLWANVLLILSSFYLYSQRYFFLAILVPRLIHDATAYIFYVTHDYNKHRLAPQNPLYRFTAACRLPIVLVLPLLSFTLAFMLQAYGDALVSQLTQTLFGVEVRKAVTLGLLGYLALLHYYTESFTWKQGSPYRQFIRFSQY